MKKCPNCKNYDENKLIVCSKCGAELIKDPRRFDTLINCSIWFVVIIGVLVLILYMIGKSNTNSKSSTTTNSSSNSVQDYKVEAKVCAEMQVEKMLKSPSTAKFQSALSSNVVTTTGPNQFVVTSYVDAQNGFGAMIRQYFKCTIQYKPTTDSCISDCVFQ